MTRRDLIAGARRVYELHRSADAKNKAYQRKRLGPILTWNQLDAGTRTKLVRAHRDLMRAYRTGRGEPTERTIRPQR